MKKFRLFFLILIGCLVNLKVVADGEILSFDEKTKEMLKRAVKEMEKDYPGSNSSANRFITSCMQKKNSVVRIRLLLGRVKCVLVGYTERDRADHCEASHYLLKLDEEKAILSPEDRLIVDAALELIRLEFGVEDSPPESLQEDAFLPVLGYI